jgi:transposase
MDEESLRLLLAQGLSVERIAQRFGKHPSTVSYWMAKHGLEPSRREKHAPKGGVNRAQLESLVETGKTIAEIAEVLVLSKATVRYWLKRYQLRTRNKVGPRIGRRPLDLEARQAGLAAIKFSCIHHGETDYAIEGRGYYRCKRCRSENIARHRRRLKEQLVSEAGGRCMLCGYERSFAALEFHHIDPTQKRFGISAGGLTQSLKTLRAEIAACVLLCSNCHAEVENGVTALPVECLQRGRIAFPSANLP